MIIIKNKIIPFKGFIAMNLFGIVFARRDLNEIDINHEKIHTLLIWELLGIGFYIEYFLEWLYRLLKRQGYRLLLAEVEAYNNEKNLDYLKTRKRYKWLKATSRK